MCVCVVRCVQVSACVCERGGGGGNIGCKDLPVYYFIIIASLLIQASFLAEGAVRSDQTKAQFAYVKEFWKGVLCTDRKPFFRSHTCVTAGIWT